MEAFGSLPGATMFDADPKSQQDVEIEDAMAIALNASGTNTAEEVDLK